MGTLGVEGAKVMSGWSTRCWRVRATAGKSFSTWTPWRGKPSGRTSLAWWVLDNAPFQSAGVIREREAEWEGRVLTLCSGSSRVLWAPEPHRGGVVAQASYKGFLMRLSVLGLRVAGLKLAVLRALHLLGAV